MSYRTIFAMSACVLLLTVSACQGPKAGTSAGPAATPTAVVAAPGQAEDVNSADSELLIRLGDKELTMQQIRWRWNNPTDEQIVLLADGWIRTELMYAEAERRGIAGEPRTKFLAEMQKKGVVAQELERRIRESVEVTDERAQEYYEQNKDRDYRLSRPGSISFSHVRTRTLEQAQSVLNRIKAGEKIEALARELSIHPDRATGGIAEKFSLRKTESAFGDDFVEAIRAANQGELVGPIELEDEQGYEVAVKHEEVPPEPRPFERVKSYIKAKLRRTEGDKLVKSLVERLKEEASGEIIKTKRLMEAEQAASLNKPARAAQRP